MASSFPGALVFANLRRLLVRNLASGSLRLRAILGIFGHYYCEMTKITSPLKIKFAWDSHNNRLDLRGVAPKTKLTSHQSEHSRDSVSLGAPVSPTELIIPYALAGNTARGNSFGDFEICGSRVLYQAVILA